MKKILIYLLTALLSLAFGLLILVWALLPPLPAQTDEIAREIIQSRLPVLESGETGFAVNNDIQIWYESREPEGKPKGTFLLIMGIGADMISWPEYFFQPLIDSGYQVIRFDNRGVGRSDRPAMGAGFTLEDMAADGVAVLDALGVDKAHVVGVSMGGMIGQSMAIHYPERLHSLISMMASGYTEDPDLPSLNSSIFAEFAALFFRYGIFAGEMNTIRVRAGVRKRLSVSEMSTLHVRDAARSALYNLRVGRGFNPLSFLQQAAAINASGARYEGLRVLGSPAFIIHGQADPLIPIEHGKKCAELIPGAQKLWIEGLGHDVSPEYADVMREAIITFVEPLQHP